MVDKLNLGQRHIWLAQQETFLGETLKLVQARRSGTFLLPNGYGDITLDVTDFETDPTFLEHNNTFTARIDVKQEGVYYIGYNVPVDSTGGPLLAGTRVECRIQKNGTTVVKGSESVGSAQLQSFGLDASGSASITRTTLARLDSGDYITLQANSASVGISTRDDTTLWIYRLGGGLGTVTGQSGDLTNQGNWSSIASYAINDIVRHEGATYIAITNSTNSEPPSNAWAVLGDLGDIPIDWQGNWVSQDYTVNQAVFFNGKSYINILNTTAMQDPTNSTFWDVMTNKPITGTPKQNNQKFFDGIHTLAVGIATEPTYTDLTLGSQRTIDTTAFAHTLGAATVTFLESANYLVYGWVSTGVFAGSARSSSRMRLQLNTGGGFVTLSGTSASMYNRLAGNGWNSCSCMIVRRFNAGDIIKVQVARHTGTDVIITLGNGAGLSLARLDAFDVPSKISSTFCDDFFGTNLDNIWTTAVVGAASSITPTSEVGGVVNVISGLVAGDSAELDFINDHVRVADLPTIKIRARLSAITQSLVNIGIQLDATNLIDFQYSAGVAGVNWFARTMSGGVTTSTDTGIAGDTSFHKFEIIAASTTRVIFKIDNVIVATNTTNIPLGIQHLRMRQESTLVATSRTLSIDYIQCEHTRS